MGPWSGGGPNHRLTCEETSSNGTELMRWIALVMLMTVVLAAPGPVRRRIDPPPRSPSRHPRLVGRLAALVRGRRADRPNPFEALRVQTRLGIIADEVRSLEGDRHVYARAHHLEATQTAYDALLAEACVLAGVATDPGARRDEQERFREEVELAARGWSW